MGVFACVWKGSGLGGCSRHSHLQLTSEVKRELQKASFYIFNYTLGVIVRVNVVDSLGGK